MYSQTSFPQAMFAKPLKPTPLFLTPNRNIAAKANSRGRSVSKQALTQFNDVQRYSVNLRGNFHFLVYSYSQSRILTSLAIHLLHHLYNNHHIIILFNGDHHNHHWIDGDYYYGLMETMLRSIALSAAPCQGYCLSRSNKRQQESLPIIIITLLT